MRIFWVTVGGIWEGMEKRDYQFTIVLVYNPKWTSRLIDLFNDMLFNISKSINLKY